MERRILPMQKLMSPKSIAIVGASAKADTPGFDTIRQLRRIGYSGSILPINPKYDEIDGLACLPDLTSASRVPDHAIIVVNNALVEQSVMNAAEIGVKAVTIFASCYMEDDSEPKLVSRLQNLATEKGMAICGANCLGLYNFADRVAASWFPVEELREGPVAFIAHSGAIFAAILGLDRQMGFSLAVSAGQELTTTVADYLDYALDMESTRVAALFIETIRDPEGFAAALQKARDQEVPVVAIKVGRTSQSALLAESHSGAIAGDDAAYQALFDRYGVVRARDVDEMAATVNLLSVPKKYVGGGLAAITDSGGARGLLIDLADDEDVRFAQIGEETTEILRSRLDYGLESVNPVDAWGTGRDYKGIYHDCLMALMNDDDTGIGMYLFDLGLEDHLSQGFVDVCLEVASKTDKPLFVASNFAQMPKTKLADRLRAGGVPVIEGVSNALRSVRNLMDHAEVRTSKAVIGRSPADRSSMDKWLQRLRANGGRHVCEADGYDLLDDWGLHTPAYGRIGSDADLEARIREIGLPLVLKTAAPGIVHKSDVDGVRIGLDDAHAVSDAYRDLAARLGPQALAVEMAPKGVELVVGGLVDPQFGPILMIGAGGVLVELVKDVVFVMAPAGRGEIGSALQRLAIAPLLDGLRGNAPVDRELLVDSIERFSHLVADVSPAIRGIEINPLLATENACIPLDVLVSAR